MIAKTISIIAFVVSVFAVKANAADEKLKVLISDAHEIFHKIVGECKKAE